MTALELVVDSARRANVTPGAILDEILADQLVQRLLEEGAELDEVVKPAALAVRKEVIRGERKKSEH